MKTKQQFSHQVGSRHGFSLVEMLVVIAVIGIIAAIAVPFAANATSEASAVRHQRNAQSLAVLANQVVASGDLTIPAAGSDVSVLDPALRNDALDPGYRYFPDAASGPRTFYANPIVSTATAVLPVNSPIVPPVPPRPA